MKFFKKLLLILLLINILALFPLFSKGFYKSADGELHLARIVSYSRALKAGHFPVRWSANLNYGYGYPIFNFVYPLPYIFASIIYLLGIPLFLTFKITLGFTLFTSSLLMFFAVYNWQKNEKSAFLVSLLYLLFPYRLLDIYIRAAFGECFAFLFPPLIVYLGLLWIKKRKKIYFFSLTLSFTSLILSHNVLSLMFLPFLIIFLSIEIYLVNKKDFIKLLFVLFTTVIFALIISSFFWLPALFELKYTLAKLYLKQKDFHDYFLSPKQLVYRPWGKQAKFIGIVPLLIVIFSLIQLIKQKNKSFQALFLLLTFFIAVFFISPYSVKLWETIPILPFFQTPWRFISLIVLAVSLLSSIFIKNTKKQIILIILFTLLVTSLSLHRLRPIPTDFTNPDFFRNYPKSTTWHNEASPVWTAGEADSYPEKPIEIIGNGKIIDFSKDYLVHKGKVQAEEEITIIDNTAYFPGWRVYLNGKEQQIQFQDPNHRGLITFQAPKGEHRFTIKFTNTKIRRLANIISILGIIILFTTILVL